MKFKQDILEKKLDASQEIINTLKEELKNRDETIRSLKAENILLRRKCS